MGRAMSGAKLLAALTSVPETGSGRSLYQTLRDSDLVRRGSWFSYFRELSQQPGIGRQRILQSRTISYVPPQIVMNDRFKQSISAVLDKAVVYRQEPQIAVSLHQIRTGVKEQLLTYPDERPADYLGIGDLKLIFKTANPGLSPTRRDLDDMAESVFELVTSAAFRTGPFTAPEQQYVDPGLIRGQVQSQERRLAGQWVERREGVPSVKKIEDLEKRVQPVEKEVAFDFIRAHHTELPDPNYRGLLETVGLWYRGKFRAVGTITTPSGALPGADRIVEVSRIASDGSVYGASSAIMLWFMKNADRYLRSANAGTAKVVTYSLLTEVGQTYRALQDQGLRPVATVAPNPTSRVGGKGGKKDVWKIRWEYDPEYSGPLFQGSDGVAITRWWLPDFHRAYRAVYGGRGLRGKHLRGFRNNPEALVDLWVVLGGKKTGGGSTPKFKSAYKLYKRWKASKNAPVSQGPKYSVVAEGLREALLERFGGGHG